jgi:hypothetical protein
VQAGVGRFQLLGQDLELFEGDAKFLLALAELFGLDRGDRFVSDGRVGCIGRIGGLKVTSQGGHPGQQAIAIIDEASIVLDRGFERRAQLLDLVAQTQNLFVTVCSYRLARPYAFPRRT